MKNTTGRHIIIKLLKQKKIQVGKIENKKKDGSFKCNHINHHIKKEVFIYWIKKKQNSIICFPHDMYYNYKDTKRLKVK